MSKFYKKKKKIMNINYFILIISVILVSMSFAYSYFSSTLNIVGKITALQDKPPIEIITPDKPGEGDATEENYITVETNLADSEILNQTFENNTLTVDYKINSISGTPRGTSISINLKNNQNYTLENGRVVSNTPNDKFFSSTPQLNITPRVVNSGELSKVIITFSNLKFNQLGSGKTYRLTISFDTPTGTENIYVVINFSR